MALTSYGFSSASLYIIAHVIRHISTEYMYLTLRLLRNDVTHYNKVQRRK